MIAIKRLQSIMWILVVAMGALSAYLISLRVATERNAVHSLERRIYETRANIRYLELEFGSRASMRQLAAWNAKDIRYSVPVAGQYLGSEQQLASLDRIAPSGRAFVAPPVMAAMAQAQPIPTAPAPVEATMIPVKAATGATAPRNAASSDFSLIKVAAAAEPVRMRPAVALSMAKPANAPRIVKLMDRADPAAARRASRLAMLDRTLLDAGTLRTLDGRPDRSATH